MGRKFNYKYDAFISYSEANKQWVNSDLIPRFISAKLKFFIDFKDFQPGATEIGEIERGIKASRKTILLLSPAYLNDKFADFENHLTRFLDPSAKQKRCIPVKIETCEIPDHLTYLVSVDLTTEDPKEKNEQWNRLLTSLKEKSGIKEPTAKSVEQVMQLQLPNIEKELRMNEIHWVRAGLTMPIGEFNFTSVYFDNQIDKFREIREDLQSLESDLSVKKVNPAYGNFINKGFTITEQIDLRARQMLDILAAEDQHPRAKTAQKSIQHLMSQSNELKQLLIRSSAVGAVTPNELVTVVSKLSILLHSTVISIEEVQKHIREIYHLTGIYVQS